MFQLCILCCFKIISYVLPQNVYLRRYVAIKRNNIKNALASPITGTLHNSTLTMFYKGTLFLRPKRSISGYVFPKCFIKTKSLSGNKSFPSHSLLIPLLMLFRQMFTRDLFSLQIQYIF